jgi:hypothetical protein
LEEIGLVGLLAPNVRLTAEDEVRGGFGDAVEGVIAVHGSPVVVGVTVVLERPEACCIHGGKVEPLSFATVEVPVVVIAHKRLISFSGDIGDGLIALPGLHDGLLWKGQVPVQEHLFPN